MNGYHKDIDTLLGLTRPTPNRVTDYFGAGRLWGNRYWHPDARYSPIHGGVDYTARGDASIVAPCDVLAWGDYRPGDVGSYIMMRPINEGGEPSKHIALYFLHCEPTPTKWLQFDKGMPMTRQAGHGIGAPHLHFEVVVSHSLGKELESRGIIHPDWVSLKDWRNKALVAGIDDDKALARVREQMNRWQIRGMYHDYMTRAAVPHYRQSQYSNVGKHGAAYFLDATLFVGE